MRLPFILIMTSMSLALAGPNLLENPRFDAPEGYMKGWEWSPMWAPIFTVSYDQGKRAVAIASSSNEYSGYLNQTVPVVPGREYVLRAELFLPLGRSLLWVVALNDQRKEIGKSWTRRSYSLADNPLFPHFVKPEYAPNGRLVNDWECLELRVKIPDGVPFVRVNVGSYFGQGIVYFRRVEFFAAD